MRSVLIVGIWVNISPPFVGRATGAALVGTTVTFGMSAASVVGTRGSAGGRVSRCRAGVAGSGSSIRVAVSLLIGAVTHIRRPVLFGLRRGIKRK